VEGWGIWVRVRHSFLVDAKLVKQKQKIFLLKLNKEVCSACFASKQSSRFHGNQKGNKMKQSKTWNQNEAKQQKGKAKQ
jgi:hypothetical protein